MEENMASMTTINDLPDEMLVEIFSYLTVEDLATSIRKVSRRWQEVAKDNKLWRNLTYSPDKTVSTDQIIDVLKGAPKLQNFIPRFEYVRGRLLESVVTYCKDIRILRMKVNKYDYSLVTSFVYECPNIESLALDCDDFTTTGYLQLIGGCQRLKCLRLFGQTIEHSHNLFSDVSNGFPSLEMLDLTYLMHYKNRDLKHFLKRKRNKLHSLCVTCCRSSQKCLLPEISKSCATIKLLHIYGHRGRPTSEDFTNFKNMQNLKELSVSGSRCLNVHNVIAYFETGHVHNLESLNLSNFGIVNKRLTLSIFTKCLNLKYLNLGRNESLTDDCLEHIGNLTSLENLYLDSCHEITDRGISYVVYCSKLKCLSLNQCEKITSQSFVACCINLKLKILNMNACEVDPDALMEMCTSEQLKRFKSLCIKIGGKKIHLRPKRAIVNQ